MSRAVREDLHLLEELDLLNGISMPPHHHRRGAGPWIAAYALAWLVVGGCSDANPTEPTSPLDGGAEQDAGDAEDQPEAGNDVAAEASTNDDADADLRDGGVDVRDGRADVEISAVCSSAVDVVEACLLSSDGAVVATPLAGSMMVSAIDEIPAGACRVTGFDSVPGMPPSGSERATRLTLDAADGSQRNVVIRPADLTRGLFRMGETIELSLQASEEGPFYQTRNQTFVLARDGQPVFVAATLNRYRGPIPDLTAAGIQLDDDGLVCRGQFAMSCYAEDHRLRIGYGGESAIALPGQTVQIGALTMVVETLREFVGGMCDRKGFSQLAGFWVPPGSSRLPRAR